MMTLPRRQERDVMDGERFIGATKRERQPSVNPADTPSARRSGGGRVSSESDSA